MASKKTASTDDVIQVIEAAVINGMTGIVARELRKASPYPWAESVEEQRRAFVFELMASPEYEADVLVKSMDVVCKWIETGQLQSVKTTFSTVTKLRNVLDDV